MQRLIGAATRIGAALTERKQSIAVGEGSCGGLVSAALVAVPGASRFFVAGTVLYTRPAFAELLRDDPGALKGLRGATEPFSLVIARLTRERFGTTWAIGESGASGPTGNRYGDAAGHAALAVAGPVEKSCVIETGLDAREENMWRFAEAALELMEQAIGQTQL
jgi:nicotinamide mononucleotide (NMN) deamidase PncC